ncbi:MAG TPA: hypothetical protein EYQ46_21375 [Myxococcales bacterium]|nr:hypothetical protein [Myxococcales bacterium]HIL81078.1 hypothetical protein [Myxococcales bacterium]
MDTLVEVRLVCTLVMLNIAQTLFLLSSPFIGDPVKEGGVDSTVEFVDVCGMTAVLKAVVLGR